MQNYRIVRQASVLIEPVAKDDAEVAIRICMNDSTQASQSLRGIIDEYKLPVGVFVASAVIQGVFRGDETRQAWPREQKFCCGLLWPDDASGAQH